MFIHHFHALNIFFLIILCQFTHANEVLSVEHSVEYENLLLQVTQIHTQAKLNHYAWRDTGKMIIDASKLAHQGEFMQANKLLRQAYQECILAEQQSSTQSDLSELIPYYLK